MKAIRAIFGVLAALLFAFLYAYMYSYMHVAYAVVAALLGLFLVVTFYYRGITGSFTWTLVSYSALSAIALYTLSIGARLASYGTLFDKASLAVMFAPDAIFDLGASASILFGALLITTLVLPSRGERQKRRAAPTT